jgi:hypothetical protein
MLKAFNSVISGNLSKLWINYSIQELHINTSFELLLLMFRWLLEVKWLLYQVAETPFRASVVEWLRHRSHTPIPLTSSPHWLKSCSDRCDCARKFVSLLAEVRWSLPKYIV